MWAETWDRSLDDIFKIQDEIAADVVSQLKITLLGAAPGGPGRGNPCSANPRDRTACQDREIRRIVGPLGPRSENRSKARPTDVVRPVASNAC